MMGVTVRQKIIKKKELNIYEKRISKEEKITYLSCT